MCLTNKVMTKDTREMHCSELSDDYKFEKEITVKESRNNEIEVRMNIDTSRPIKWIKEGKFNYNRFILIFHEQKFKT